jgi:hypothetical protein
VPFDQFGSIASLLESVDYSENIMLQVLFVVSGFHPVYACSSTFVQAPPAIREQHLVQLSVKIAKPMRSFGFRLVGYSLQ